MRIHRVTLAAADPAAQARFWRETLGLPVDEAPGGVEVRLRWTTIAFTAAGAGEEPRYHFAVNVPRGRIEDALAWLRERVDVLPFEDGDVVVRFDGIGADAVYFLDAGGNVVELMANDRLPRDDGTPFGPGSLFEMAEIGIASADVPATAAAVREALGAPVYWGGGEGLTAVGDAHGAVLVSPEGRGWIPIGLPAVPVPTRIVAEGAHAGTTAIPGGPYEVETVTSAPASS